MNERRRAGQPEKERARNRTYIPGDAPRVQRYLPVCPQHAPVVLPIQVAAHLRVLAEVRAHGHRQGAVAHEAKAQGEDVDRAQLRLVADRVGDGRDAVVEDRGVRGHGQHEINLTVGRGEKKKVGWLE